MVCWHLYLTHNTLSLQNAHAHDTTARTLSLRKSRLIGQDSTQKYQLSGTTQQAIAHAHSQNQVMATKQQQIVQRFIPAATGKLSVPTRQPFTMLNRTLPETAWITSTSRAPRTYGYTLGITQCHHPRRIQEIETSVSTPQPTTTQHTPRKNTRDAPHRTRGVEPPPVIQHAIKAPDHNPALACRACQHTALQPRHSMATLPAPPA